MNIEECVLKTYPTVQPYTGINAIEDQLTGSGYLVVTDTEGLFYGILTPSDILLQPHKLVIDCLTPKEKIFFSDSIADVLRKFSKASSEALPVFKENDFVGILNKNCALEKLKTKIEELYKDSIISKDVKNVFLNNLSHEIRTPLNQFLGFINLVIDFSPEELKANGDEYYNIIKNSSEQFLSTMNDLIELSLLNSGEILVISKDTFSPEAIFSDLKNYFETIFKKAESEIEINYYNPDPSLNIYSDGNRIKQVLFHMLDSAIRHSSGKKIINFGYEMDQNKNTIRFFVRNICAKLNETQKAIILEAFEENDSIHYNLGFGVELIKRIVEKLNGSFEMIFDEENILTGYFSIPLNE